MDIYLSKGLNVSIDIATGKTIGLADGFDWDVVVIQRPMADWQVEALRDCRRKGIRTVVEVDDDFESLHHLVPAFLASHPKTSDVWNHQHLRTACREADLVVVTTKVLAERYASHGRVAIVPNYIPKHWLKIETKRTGNVVGWTGTIVTHRDDLKVTRGGVAQAIRESNARFRVIGRPEQVKQELSWDSDLEFVPWRQWEDYPQVVAKLDVGIAPLANTAFNRSKSAVKPLEYAALGVPSVVSPLPSYRALTESGIGILAEDHSREWRRNIKHLLEDDSYRAEISIAGRETAAEYTIEKNAYRFAEAWCGTKVYRRTPRTLYGVVERLAR